MADFQRVVEFLRDLRQGPLQSVSEELAQAAADYAALCNHANERLRQCSQFLQQGLRTEAIHLAEESPNLLDLVAALDLPDQAQWVEFCQNNNLPVPPPLQLDRAAQLNEAYAQDQPLEHLLARHRLLALARAPVHQRLAIMRGIARIDPGNANWEKDIRTFEKARLRELPTAFYAAVKNRDEAGIAGLQDEIQHQAWLEPIPADLAAAVTDAFSRMQRAGVEAELRKLVEPLREAFAARSLQECQALANRWKHIMTAAGVTAVTTGLTDEIKPVLTWIAEQTKRDEHLRRFKESCRTFARMLDQDALDAQLEAGYARLKEFREEIPEELTRRYQGKRATRRDSADRSHKVRLAVIGAVTLIVLAIGFFVVILAVKSAAAKKHADHIDSLLSLHSRAGNDQAQSYVADLQKNSPSLLKEPEIANAAARLQAQLAEYVTDRDTLDAWLKKAEIARQSAAALPADAPLRDLAHAAVALQSAIDATRTGRSLAWVDAEQRIAPTVNDLQTDLAGIQSRIAAGVRRELDGLSAGLDALPTASTSLDVIAESRSQVTAVATRLGALRDLPGLDDATQTAINVLAQKLTQRRQAIDSTRDVADELEILRRQTASVAALQKSLEDFVRKFPRDPRSPDFTQAAARIPMAGALEAWRDLSAGFAGVFVPSTADAAQKRLDDINAYLAAFPASPITTQVNQYADYLRRENQALSDKGTWQTGFADVLAAPLFSDLAYMEISDGRRYYVLGDIKRTESKINGQVSVSFQSINPRKVTDRLIITVDPPNTVKGPIPVPHAKVVSELGASIKLINDKNWETFGIDFADQLVKNTDMELIVKAILLQQTLKIQDSVTGWATGDLYRQILSDLDRQNPNELPWIDSRQIPVATRTALRQTIESLPPSNIIKQKLADRKAELFKSITFDITGLGVLLKDDQGWTVSSRLTPSSGCKLCTVAPAAPGMRAPPATGPAASNPAPPEPGQLLTIGAVVAGKYSLDDNALRYVPQGSIVIILAP